MPFTPQNFKNLIGPALQDAWLNNLDQMVNNTLGGTPTVPAVQVALGISAASAITSVPVTIPQGGTGATTASSGLANLGGVTPAAALSAAEAAINPYPSQTAAELAASVVPLFPQFSADPVDPRRYGADPTGVIDSTVAMNKAIAVALAGAGRVRIGSQCNFLCGALVINLNGNLSHGIVIEGASSGGSVLQLNGNPTIFLQVLGPTPGGNPVAVPFIMENVRLQGLNNSTHGLQIAGVGYWRLKNCITQGFYSGVYLFSALVGDIDAGSLQNNVYGILAQTDGAGTPCTLVSVRNTRIIGNTQWGIDCGSGDRWKLEAVDIESNGSGGGGGVVIRSTFGALASQASVDLDGCWFEANANYSLYVENNSNALKIAIDNVEYYDSLPLKILGCASLSVEDFNGPSGTLDLAARNGFLKNVYCGTLIDTGITIPVYFNVQTSTGFQDIGRVQNNVALTVSGGTGQVGIFANFILQGNEVTMEVNLPMYVSSSTTSCTITGIPAKYYPAANPAGVMVNVTNAGLTVPNLGYLSNSGVLTLYWNGVASGFSGSGNKGIDAGYYKWRIAQ